MQIGGKSGTTPILISLPINGQPTTVLLDPITMQVLGTVQSQQGSNPSGSSLGQSGTVGLANHSPIASQASSIGSNNANKSKSGKNSGNQRAICPKPSAGNEFGKSQTLKKKKSKAANRNKDVVQPDSLSDSLQIQIPESTTDPETTSAISSESTDILAKAAESIFSSPLGEISTVGGFYNPANEDNPLHIDTSAAEADDENKSPDKGDGRLKKSEISCASSVQNNVIGINSVADGKSVTVTANISKVSTSCSVSVVNSNEVNHDNENVTSLSATWEEIAGIKFGDSGDISLDIQDKQSELMDICMETPNKGTKKAKTVNSKTADKKDATGDKKDTGLRNNKPVKKTSDSLNRNSSPKKQSVDRLSDVDKSDTDSQMDIESTLIHIPEAINFSANDIVDVLDQVERLGNPPIDSPKSSASNKKSKSKRSKAIDSDGEPSSKKRKSAKDGKEMKNPDTMRDLPIGVGSSLPSVYDFDDSDDIVPSILPLNAKDYTTLSSKSGSIEGVNKQLQPIAESKSKPQPSQKQNKTSKTVKDVETAQKPSLADLNSPLFAFPESTDKRKEIDKSTEKSDPKTNQTTVSESLPTMPELDTTTSLFGYVVPKKRPDSSRQVSPKPITSVQTTVSQSLFASTKTTQSSSKQAMVSPKSTNIVSPQETNTSPEQSVVSPKLTIVSPSQNLLSENDSSLASKEYTELTSPGRNSVHESSAQSVKGYTEMTPVKKRTIVDKSDELKVSSFSALNSDVSMPYGGKENLYSSAPTTQSLGVITSVKSDVPSAPDKVNDSISRNMSDNQNMPFRSVCSDNGQVNAQGTLSSSVVNQRQTSNARNYQTNVMGDKNFSSGNLPPPSSYKTGTAPQRTPASSQNNQYGSNTQFMHDPVFNTQSNNTKPIGKENSMRASPMASVNSYQTQYKSDSLFTNTQEKVIKSPPNVNISTNPSILNQQKVDHANMSKNRNNAYSVDSFVQSSRDNSLQMRSDGLSTQSEIGMASSDLNNPTNEFSRLQNENSPDSFSIATIGLNLTPITSTTPSSSFMDLNLANSTSTLSSNTSSSSFSFSLTSSSTTMTTSSSGIGNSQFPFYPPLSSSAPGSNDSVMPSMSNMGMFPPHGNNNNNVIQRNNTVMHPSGSSSNLQRGDSSHISRVESSNISRVDNHTMPRSDNSQALMSKEVRDQNNSNKPSCSKQNSKMPKPPNQTSMQEPFSFPNANSNEPNFFHDTHMKSNVGKSPTEQMRKPQESMSSAQSRPGTQGSHNDKRPATIDRSPQMMNSSQSFYSSFPPAKSLNTPPLHHPSLMPQDERGRSMSNRSPYDAHYPPPSSSQPYSSMPHNYPNRFDSGNINYSRENAGTQPLSHTPINSGGRKSANPQQNQQTSVVKPPPKQAAPPLVPMAPQQQQPTPQGPRPTPPQSHRPTTPLSNPPQPAPTPQVNPGRQSKAPSRNSKPQKKSTGTKPIPFVDVDSNLSNSIFETNRSITPFFPMQNLSPQSRAMQHESSPFLHGNFFGPGHRFPNSNTPMPKNSDIGPHFNPLFPPRGAQNGLGLNFQPGFGMNPLHGNHGNGPQITPHTAPHMANFSLNNIFPDSGSQNESSLNISPIKFPHTNFQHQGMDPNAMQQHHPYNRGHPSVMSINSILGPNHHGFDGRMNTSMAGPFHSHGHPSFIPPLNFSMHDP